MKKRILDVGCGLKKIPGADGLDIVPLKSVDIVHDLNIFPYPIRTNTYDEIYCLHVLEHVDDMLRLMEEIYRVAKKGAFVHIRGPHASCSSTVWIDPTHKRGLTTRMFRDYFSVDGTWVFYTKSRFRVERIRLSYVLTDSNSRIPKVVSGLFDWLANRSQTAQELCERLWANWVGGFEEIEVILRVEK